MASKNKAEDQLEEAVSPKKAKTSHEEPCSDYAIFGIGNPLLDISAEVPKSLLEKYEVKTNDAILAVEKHLPLYDELVKEHQVQYIAGGATQNTLRVAQWMIQTPKSTLYIGSVGKDSNGEQLRKSAEADGLTVLYSEDESAPTGVCACLINEKERSLITSLNAANNFKLDHLQKPEIEKAWHCARFIYIEGYFLTVSLESILHLAEHASKNNKMFSMNLSAPFIPQFFKEQQLKTLPYCDYIFGNESEAQAFAKANELKDESPEAVVEYLANMPKTNGFRDRVAVITQGANDTLVFTEGKLHKFPVPPLASELIVDSNGAGDAFVGGFLAHLAQGKALEECVRAGHYASRTILQVSGTVLSGKPDFE